MTSSEVTAKIRQRRFKAATIDRNLIGRSGAIISWTTTGTVAAETKKYANKSDAAIVRNHTTPKAINCV